MKIIHFADVHIPNSQESRPYMKMLEQSIREIYTEIKDEDPSQVRILIAGDIFHNKIKASNEAKTMFHSFLNYLNEMGCQVIIYAGNHDMLENNTDRTDSITPTFEIDGVFSNIVYADKVLGYKSGTIVDDEGKIIWALFSIFDHFKRPEIETAREEHPDYKIIGLYHGEVVGAVTDNGRNSDEGLSKDVFSGCDCAMLGHIHRYQSIRYDGIPIVYSSSLFQQDCDENTTGHGFVIWNLDNLTHELHEVSNDYRIFKIVIHSYDDFNNDVEDLVNL